MQNDQLIKKHKIMLTAQFPVDLVTFTEEIFNENFISCTVAAKTLK